MALMLPYSFVLNILCHSPNTTLQFCSFWIIGYQYHSGKKLPLSFTAKNKLAALSIGINYKQTESKNERGQRGTMLY